MKTNELVHVELITIALLLASTISCVSTTQVETLHVSRLAEGMLIINLDEGEKFSGSISVSGGANNDIDFRITLPSGNLLRNFGRVRQEATFEFTAQESGAFTFHFGNTFSSISNKTIYLSYDVAGTLRLPPSMLFLMVHVCIVAASLIFRQINGKKQTMPKASHANASAHSSET